VAGSSGHALDGAMGLRIKDSASPSRP
jgi:hypothetical protein